MAWGTDGSTPDHSSMGYSYYRVPDDSHLHGMHQQRGHGHPVPADPGLYGTGVSFNSHMHAVISGLKQ